jgi:regulatory protein
MFYTNNGTEVDLFADQVFYCRVLVDTIIEAGIFLDKKIDKKDLKEYILIDLKKRLFRKALNYISIRPHSTKEVSDYLQKSYQGLLKKNNYFVLKEEENIVLQELITKLKESNYLNDVDFIKWIIESRISTGKKSRKESQFELTSKGISSIEAQENIKKLYSEEDELKVIENLIIKKFFNNKALDLKTKQKLINYFLRRGFSYELIKKAVSKIFI